MKKKKKSVSHSLFDYEVLDVEDIEDIENIEDRLLELEKSVSEHTESVKDIDVIREKKQNIKYPIYTPALSATGSACPTFHNKQSAIHYSDAIVNIFNEADGVLFSAGSLFNDCIQNNITDFNLERTYVSRLKERMEKPTAIELYNTKQYDVLISVLNKNRQYLKVPQVHFGYDLSNQNKVHICDSGGFTAMSIKDKLFSILRDKKEKERLLRQLVKWQSENANHIMTFEIPSTTRLSPAQFEEQLDISMECYQYYDTAVATGETTKRPIKIIHGYNDVATKKWAKKCLDFKNIHDVAFSFAKNEYNIFKNISALLELGYFENENTKLLHILGFSSLTRLQTVCKLQELLNKKTNNRIQVTFDSTTYAQHAFFMRYMLYSSEVDKIEMLFLKSDFLKNGLLVKESNLKLPCSIDCPVCKHLDIMDSYTETGKFSPTQFTAILILHNLYVFIHLIKKNSSIYMNFTDIVFDGKVKNNYLKETLPKMECLEEMFANPNNAGKILQKFYYRYEHLFINNSRNKTLHPLF